MPAWGSRRWPSLSFLSYLLLPSLISSLMAALEWACLPSLPPFPGESSGQTPAIVPYPIPLCQPYMQALSYLGTHWKLCPGDQVGDLHFHFCLLSLIIQFHRLHDSRPAAGTCLLTSLPGDSKEPHGLPGFPPSYRSSALSPSIPSPFLPVNIQYLQTLSTWDHQGQGLRRIT